MAYQQKRYTCESSFVEDDDGVFVYEAERRERARINARMHQRLLAEDLSRVTADEYQTEILAWMEQMEAQTMPDVNSIDIQTEIQWFMRPYLLDFLIEAHMAFQLYAETLYLAVNLLDRYCSRRVVYKRHYQLVGCASLLIAAKYGDKKERVPTIKELKSMCCQLYDDEMFTQMEWHVLSTLDWQIGHPTVDSFLQLALSETEYDAEVEHMTWYFCEIALFHRQFVATPPSVLTRSALSLSRLILGRPQASPSTWAGSTDSQIVRKLSECLQSPSQVLSRKYASMHLSSVSTLLEDFLRQQMQIAQRQQQHQQHLMQSPPPLLTSIEEQNMGHFDSPHTPQKPHHNGTSMHYGSISPPITPEDERFAAMQNLKPQPVEPQVHYPSTPNAVFEGYAASHYDYLVHHPQSQYLPGHVQ